MSQDAAARARVAGKDAVAARTAWALTIGGLRVRCVRDDDARPGARYEVQSLIASKWSSVAHGEEPLGLLRRLVSSGSVEMAVDLRREEITKVVGT